MGSSLQLTTTYPIWLVLSVALLLWLVFLWKEWQGQANQRFMIHGLVSLLAVLALVIIALQPAFAMETDDAVVLKTDNYQETQLDSLEKAKPKLKSLTYQPGSDIQEQVQDFSTVFVIGDGLAPFDFWQLADKHVVLLSNMLPEGVQQVFFDNKLIVGDTLKVGGYYKNSISNTSLVLTDGNGTPLDSIKMMDTKKAGFQLKMKTKAAGNYSFELQEKDSTGRVFNQNPIPVQVAERENLKVLILNNFPSFETKYLKNFLGDEGHEVIVRSQITKQKYKFEYLNTPRKPVYTLSEELLTDVDVLVIDADIYLNFSSSVRNILEQAIKNGMGVFLQSNERLLASRRNPLASMLNRTYGRSASVLPVLDTKVEKYRFEIKKEKQVNTMRIGDYGLFLQQGQGRIATSVLSNTYQLKLKGESATYRHIWTSFIDKISKPRQAAIHFNTNNAMAFVGQRFDIGLQSQNAPSIRHEDGYALAVLQHPENRQRWSVTTFPKKESWNSIVVRNDSVPTFSYYVMHPTQWKTAQEFQMQLENKRFFTKGASVENKTKVYQKIPLFWFFLLFLLSYGYLWAYPKLR